VLVKDLEHSGGGGAAGPELRSHPPPPPPVDDLIVAGDFVFFRGHTTSYELKLWRSDGTEAGTIPVADVSPGIMVAVGDQLVFSANEREVWKSDGSGSGTHRIWPRQANAVESEAYVAALWSVGDHAYFIAPDGQLGAALWATDATEDGTRFVTQVGAEYPYGFTRAGDTVFFSSASRSTTALWRTNGTEAGTLKLRDFPQPSPAAFSAALELVALNEGVLFGAVDDHGLELWRSDGTAEGTVFVRDINPGPADSRARSFTRVGDRVFFVANDGATGDELWQSDGTAEGTRLVKDIHPGPANSYLSFMTEVDARLVFSVCDSRGCTAWQSDGSEAGTGLLGPLLVSAYPGPFVPLGSLLFFPAFDAHGQELWAMRLPLPPFRAFDCNADEQVLIDDLVAMVNVALGSVRLSACVSGDRNGDGQITVDEITGAVSAVLQREPRPALGERVRSASFAAGGIPHAPRQGSRYRPLLRRTRSRRSAAAHHGACRRLDGVDVSSAGLLPALPHHHLR
jgi:ELWxxDGT repeat protein